jgi:hypothetical protein
MDLTSLERLPLWIGGRARAGRDQALRRESPTRPPVRSIRHVPLGDAPDVDAAVAGCGRRVPGVARPSVAARVRAS